ncbi:MAG: protein-L-isoaspartate(D-aspartate) O-methyltransferase [Bacteroidales bacterium]|nr:protein-L-isoaspartate(D-aspartate) O-methyltransferase [Bacteroidales bacterium]
MIDTFRHQGLRRKLVETIKSKGIKNENVLDAIGKVPRHLFMDNAFVEFAYKDNAFPIAAGQTISQPYTVAYQTELLQVQKGEKILEVGTGSGYQACVLHEMGARVFTIERQAELFKKTKAFLPQIGYNLKMFFGDGYAGLPTFAPFNKIIVTAGAPEIPKALIEQLKVGGIMVIPVNHINFDGIQVMTTVTKIDEQNIEIKEWDSFRFVPLLQNKNY